jgi:hypothetical protein
VNNTSNNEYFQSFETLVAIEIKKILSEYNYDVFYQKNNGIYGIIQNFHIVGEFEFKNSSRKTLHFEMNFPDNIIQKNTVYYGKTEKENYLVPFLDSLKKDVQVLSNLKKI